MDPLALRWVERIIVALGGICFGFLGYRLFIFGVEKGTARVSAETKLFKLVFSGTAPGLFFMLCGCAILVLSLTTELRRQETTTTTTERGTRTWQQEVQYEKEYLWTPPQVLVITQTVSLEGTNVQKGKSE